MELIRKIFKSAWAGPRPLRWARAALTGVLLLAGHFLCSNSDVLSSTLRQASFDWLYKLSFFNQPNISEDGVAIIYVDELSQTMLKQPRNRPWDRRIYAAMIDRLREEGARAVVLDVIFSGPSTEEEDDALETAIRDNGRVILGVDMATGTQSAAGGVHAQFETLVFPEQRFVDAAAGVGLVHLKSDQDFIVREHYHMTPYDGLPSLSWAAAALAGITEAKRLWPEEERWVHYYGGPETIPHFSFAQVLLESSFPRPGFFKDKVVFIGARPATALLVERRDEFRSSFSTATGRFLFMPAVEVHASMFLNLQRQDWLRRTPPAIEALLVILSSALFFAFARPLKPLLAAGASLAAALLIFLAAVLLFAQGWWTPWLVFLLYIPAGFTACVIYSSLDWLAQRKLFRAQEKRAARKIQEQAALLDKTGDAIVVMDLEWKPAFWNDGARRTYGWSREAVADARLDELLFHDRNAMLSAQAETIQSGQWGGEMTHRTQAGKEIRVHSRWSLLKADDGAVQGILMINSDITLQRELEAQLLRSQRLDSLGTLAGGIAHDLNNVLSPILMGCELVRMKVPVGPAHKLLDTIEASAQRGAALVRQVLTFTRGVSGEQKIVQVRHILKEMDKILAETFPKNVNVSIQVCPKLKTVNADITQLHQVLLNLCVNARDAMPNGGQLKIDARNVDTLPPHLKGEGGRISDFIVISVSDTGTGIPPEIAEKIFEPFFTTKELGKGTGLGLATVASIVRKHQGCLDYKSVVGQGTEFLIYLPAAIDESESTETGVLKGPLSGNEELILVVDDEQPVRATLEEILTASNFRVITATHASAALEIVADSGSSLGAVLMDRMMPGMDSLKAMRHMKLRHPDLPIICMSGVTPPDQEALDRVADGFLLKPFNRERLVQMLKEKLKSQRPDCIALTK